MYGTAGITLQPHTGEVPSLLRKSYRDELQVHEDEQSRQRGEIEQSDWNSRTGSPNRRYAHGNGVEKSHVWL
jgi:hypothetical protein